MNTNGSHGPLDAELESLERALRNRPRASASAELERKVLHGIRRSEARERRTRWFAFAACAASFAGLHLWLSALAPVQGAQVRQVEPTSRELALAESAGIDGELLRQAARVRALASLPRESAPLGSRNWNDELGGR